MNKISNFAIKHPKSFMAGVVSLVTLTIALVALPSVSQKASEYLNTIHIDTDPENMLSKDEPVRVFHNDMKKEFGLYDMVVVGVINDTHPQGVFNVETLGHVFELTQFIEQIQWEEGGQQKGVIGVDVIAPSTVDNIEQGGLGTVRFEWLMEQAPQTEEEALAIANKAKRIPFLQDTLISTDHKALAIYVPISSKDVSYEVAQKIQEKIDSIKKEETYHITGLPIAQDQFGVEMFKQMAVSAPLAMALIFLLMWFFFRSVGLIIAPMIVAMVSVIFTMGALVISGNTIHIMSSMIPIFIMPIAVLDAVHILSDFFDRYPRHKDCHLTIQEVMADLHSPMLFTSLTTAAGFFSLAFTPIPPVQVFGVFIGIGVLLAWFLTVTLVPAYIVLLPKKSLENFGKQHCEVETTQGQEQVASAHLIDRLLSKLGNVSYQRAKLIVVLTIALVGVAYMGIQKIQINDNPVNWFEPSHPIRVADKALNEKFAGTYMAYLTLVPQEAMQYKFKQDAFDQLNEQVKADMLAYLTDKHWLNESIDLAQLKTIRDYVFIQQDAQDDDVLWEAWDQAGMLVDAKMQEAQIFKRPDVLAFIEKLQAHLQTTGIVGKSNALPDVVKTVHRELFLGKDEAFRVPDSSSAVAQTLITYQGGHRPQDLWHFVTPSYDKSNIWIQLNSGDNKDMQALVASIDEFMQNNDAPIALRHQWFGLTYINVIWQQKMVAGMLESFGGSFIIVLLMMIFLFRSVWWGILSMIPLTVSIAFIYGIIGFIGKDYDMPVAVLSSLSLGLAVDYAIHFLARSRQIRKQHKSWKAALEEIYEEPARAILRNVIVIGIGFTPLLMAPLIPYQTVGVFISAILLLAGGASLIILPAVITAAKNILFKNSEQQGA
ncbi:MMPL family transporter [bacterium]|nr:MMPL family transporter [bacterium]